jgi:hypothetical protein
MHKRKLISRSRVIIAPRLRGINVLMLNVEGRGVKPDV